MLLLAVASIAIANQSASAQMMSNGAMKDKNPMVGGAATLRSMDIVVNAVSPANQTKLVAAVKGAGLVESLKSEAPFTVFAASSAGFDKLPAGTVDTLVKPEINNPLTRVLTNHLVAGRL